MTARFILGTPITPTGVLHGLFQRRTPQHRPGRRPLRRIRQNDPLLRKPRPAAESRRTESGYRQYGAAEVHTLRFIRRARTLGFGMAEIAALLQLWQDRERASKEVKRIALERIEDLEKKIGEMQAMKNTLENLALGCQGDDRPDCPILDDLASQRPELPKSRPLDQILP